jgi:hypothetical protein
VALGSDLSESEARDIANELVVRHNSYGLRHPANVRRPDKPQPVAVAEWRPGGVLEVWIREDGEWWGLVRDTAGQTSWHPAADLRLADDLETS